jgi:excisionase family DNA binding protein
MEGLISVVEASKQLAIGEEALRRRLRSGRVKGQKLGRDWFLPLDEVDRLAAEYPLESVGSAK